MHPSLRGYASAVVEPFAVDPVALKVADDVQAIHHLVARTPELGVVVTDFGVPTTARRALLEELLASRVERAALRLVLWAVESERADELFTVFHDLYEFIVHMHDLTPESFEAEEPSLSLSGWRRFFAGYADAVFEDIPETSELEEIEDELFRLARIVDSHPALRSALSDTGRPLEARAALLAALLEGKARPATVRLAALSLHGRARDPVGTFDWMAVHVAQARGWRVARVFSALPIDDDEQDELAQVLQAITHRPVELQITEERGLLGGAVVQIGDLLVDATASHRLDQMRENLLGAEGSTTGAHF